METAYFSTGVLIGPALPYFLLKVHRNFWAISCFHILTEGCDFEEKLLKSPRQFSSAIKLTFNYTTNFVERRSFLIDSWTSPPWDGLHLDPSSL